jgi:hypothetical protein
VRLQITFNQFRSKTDYDLFIFGVAVCCGGRP